jgi:acyl carrier protein
MEMMEMTEKVRQFILANFYLPNAEKLSNSASLLDSGIIDSTGVLEVIAWVEREWDITVEDRDMVPANFGSIDNIANYAARKSDQAQTRDVGAAPGVGK